MVDDNGFSRDLKLKTSATTYWESQGNNMCLPYVSRAEEEGKGGHMKTSADAPFTLNMSDHVRSGVNCLQTSTVDVSKGSCLSAPTAKGTMLACGTSAQGIARSQAITQSLNQAISLLPNRRITQAPKCPFLHSVLCL